MYDIIIIGAGVTGCAVARYLSRYEGRMLVLEKAEDVCCGTSKANSAIVHAGFDAAHGSLMAKMNLEGNLMMPQLAKDLDFAFKMNGSLVVCMSEEDLPKLRALYENGVKNGVKELEIVDAKRLHELEPNVSKNAVAALWAPTGGIVCPFNLTIALAENAFDNGVEFQFNTEVTNVIFEFKEDKKIATAIECKVNGIEKGIVLTENDLVFVTNGSCTEGTIYGDQNHAPNGDAEVRTSGCWSLWKNIAAQDPSFGHPEKFCSDISKTNWESATITTLDDKIIPYITDICKRDPRTGKVVTGGIVSCQDSRWLLSWTINRQGQFKDQDKDKVCVWVYGLFTDVPGDYIKKPMKDCTGKEITEEWLYHLGVPEEQIEELAENSAVCVPTMMPYITAFFMPRAKGDRPDVIPDGCVNFAFLGQFADTPRDTVFTTEYSVRTAMEAVYGLLGVDRGIPEVWGSVYDIRELLSSSVKLMDGKSPLEIEFPGANLIKKPLLHFIRGTVIEKILRDYDVLKDGM